MTAKYDYFDINNEESINAAAAKVLIKYGNDHIVALSCIL